ncbi:hypothetical protein TSUD_329740 [Trifolium subterraneum]|nr:hypothetical protein TSUD_329740 [Trifolium subterraneum]
MLWQNSITKWLLEGDANSKKIHVLANSRKRKNLIVLLDVNGIHVEGFGDIRESIFNHFSSQFKSQRISRPDVGNLDFKTISESEANVLVAAFGEDEIKQAVWDCDSFKSPGPDGVLAKLLANRLSKMIGNVISVNQSAFVEGRQILDAEGLDAMVNASVHANLFSGFSVGEDVPFQITHLQFADDTLMVTDKNWANIRVPREKSGGLGVRKVKEFNVALLGKWCSRLRTERDGFWRQVRNGEDSLFWDDPWLEKGVSLRDRFPRRPLFVWEEELVAGCCGLFHNVVLQPNKLYRWHWRSLHSDVFTIKGAYQTLTRAEEEAEPMLNSTELVWNKVVPVKVSVFAWRFMENRIPTRDNLFKRGILYIDAQHCVLGCGFDETLSHLSLLVIRPIRCGAECFNG